MGPGESPRETPGFTLVELVVAMLVLAILTVIAIPTFFSIQDSARDGVAKADLSNAKTAQALYVVDHGGNIATSASSLEEYGFTPTDGVTHWIITGDAVSYCIQATSENNTTFTVRNDHGVAAGLCTP
jgi:prepilin-type N-terminal cleavage/methylation domain-containing protein